MDLPTLKVSFSNSQKLLLLKEARNPQTQRILQIEKKGLQSQQDLAQLINLEHGSHRHESRLSQSTYSSHFTEIIKSAEENGVQLCVIHTRCFVPTWYFDSVLVMPQLNTAILDQIMVPHIRYPNYVGVSWILLHISASKEFNLQKEPCSSIVR